MIVNNFPDRILDIDGTAYLYFGGTSYLGIATHPEFLQLLGQSLQQWGTAYGSSRNANITLSVYDRAETLLAEKTGAGAAAVVSSGTLAGKIVTENLLQTGVRFYHYPKTHPAILVTNSLPLLDAHGTIHPDLLNDKEEPIVITSDAVLGLATGPTDFDFLNSISKTKKITLVLDESHSMGLLGEQGWGIFKNLNKYQLDRVIMVSSLGKAMGISGGVIASDTQFIKNIKNDALFVSSSGANPAYFETFLKAQHIYEAQQEKLKKNLEFVRQHLKMQPKLHFNHNYPVIYVISDTIFATLQREKMIISSFKYPTYHMRMNRIVITSNHTIDDLKILIELLNSFEI